MRPPPSKADNLPALLVCPDASLIDAMRVIDRQGIELVFVAGPDGRVLGTLSDGDVRRAILQGAAIDAPGEVDRAMNRDFVRVGPEVDRAGVLDVMRARHIRQVPVLDDAGRLIALHLLQELIGASARPNVAVIMAGGRGVRLRPLTEHVPKPMLPVAGRPILERLILHLVGYGFRDIYIAVNYLGDLIARHFGDGSSHACRIRYLRERRPLGTGGPLSLLPRGIAAPVLVLNGDLVTQADLDRVMRFHVSGAYAATTCVRPYQVEVPFGVVDVDRERLVGLREKPSLQFLVSAGIYVLSPEVVARVPRGREYPITALIDDCLSEGLAVGAHLLDGEWIDVGRHEELRRARGQ